MFGVSTWVWLYRRNLMVKDIAWYEGDKRKDGKTKVITMYEPKAIPEGLHFLYFLALILIVGVGCLSMFT